MILKVIYRRKTESLAPGRGLLLNYILWGVEVRGGQQQGSASHPLPLQVLSLEPPQLQASPCGSCCWRGNSLFSVGD